MNKEELDNALLKWRGIFEEYKLPFIIYQSMVLGLVREGRFFDERVAEFAVLGEDIEPVLDAMKADKRLAFQQENPHLAPHGLLYFTDCEIMPVYFKNGKAVYNLARHECLVYSEELLRKENWSTVRYLDLDWKIPGNPEQYLEEGYGNWRVEDKTHHWTKAINLRGWDQI